MYLLLLASWLFDFQSESEGQGVAIQGLFAAAYLFALTILLIGDRAAGKRVRGLLSLVCLGFLYLLIGVASGLVNGQTSYQLLRNSLNVFVYLSAAYVTARVVMSSNPSQLRFVLAVFCLAYAITAYLIFNFMNGGIDPSKVRYQIVGASAIAALGYIALAPLFGLRKLEFAAIAVSATFILFSVTRTFLVALAAQMSVYLGRIGRVLSPRLIVVALAAMIAGFGVLAYGQLQLARWTKRLVGAGGSDTSQLQGAFTRFSEWNFMYDAWTQSPLHFLFGSGIAARTLYFIPSEAGGGTGSMIGFGHNQHLSMLFTAGVIGGLPLLLLQMFQVYLAWRFLRLAIRLPRLRTDAVFLGAWGATIVLGSGASHVVSSTFALRGASLWFGIGTGLLLGAQALFDPDNAPRRPAPKRPAAAIIP